ncbi:ATP-binding cassette domain-containing protein, partial [Klebsiella pneumoniae]|uniref:ATP-binding cassette domain-containing protein n=1 Tax=Klebsiella pneumoniae TaxID=573 RepID=UPI003744D467
MPVASGLTPVFTSPFARLSVARIIFPAVNPGVSQSLNVTIPDGHFTAIIGPNGCGKSSLLRTLSRL